MGKTRKRMRHRSRDLQGAGAEVEERGVEQVVELRRLEQRLGNRQRHLVELGRRWLKKTTTMRMMKTKMWSCLMTMMTLMHLSRSQVQELSLEGDGSRLAPHQGDVLFSKAMT